MVPTTRLDDLAKGACEFRIAVMDEVSTVIEKTPFVHGDISRDLLHPGFRGMRCDANDLNTTALEMSKEQYVVSDQVTYRQHFHGEEVGPSENVHVGANKAFPRCLPYSLRCGRDAVATEDVAHRLIR